MLPFWNFQKITISSRTTKTTLARFLKFPEISLTWFLYGYKMRTSKDERWKALAVAIASGYLAISCKEMVSSNTKKQIK